MSDFYILLHTYFSLLYALLLFSSTRGTTQTKISPFLFSEELGMG